MSQPNSTTPPTAIALLTSLPRTAQRRWIARTFTAPQHRELAATAADLVAFPQPLDSPQLRDCVVGAAEAILAPYQNSLRRTVSRYRWRFVRYAASAAIVASVVVGATLIFVATTKTSGVNNSASANSDAPTIATASPQVESKTERPAEPLRATNRASLARLAAFTQGELLRSLGKTFDELTPHEREARVLLAAALESLQQQHTAAEAVRRNQLGIALSLQAASLRESGIDVATLEPEIFNNADSVLQAASAGDTHDVSLTTTSNDAGHRTLGGADDSVRGESIRAVTNSSAAWGELPMTPQTRSPRDEVMLLPPQYRRAGTRFVE